MSSLQIEVVTIWCMVNTTPHIVPDDVYIIVAVCDPDRKGSAKVALQPAGQFSSGTQTVFNPKLRFPEWQFPGATRLQYKIVAMQRRGGVDDPKIQAFVNNATSIASEIAADVEDLGEIVDGRIRGLARLVGWIIAGLKAIWDAFDDVEIGEDEMVLVGPEIANGQNLTGFVGTGGQSYYRTEYNFNIAGAP